MAGLLVDNGDDPPQGSRTSPVVFVEGDRYVNSAAKFWPSLVDEIEEHFPGCTTVMLRAASDVPLSRDLLFPKLALEEAFTRMLLLGPEESIDDLAAEIHLLGPPSPVEIRLLAGEEEQLSRHLPLECVDSETFPYLCSWLLEWAKVPDAHWASPSLAGDIVAEDRPRKRTYRLVFALEAEHVSEGLFHRTLTVRHSVEDELNTTAP